ncbi:MAG TPA: phosphoribosylformylglycinamidine cyclo-ligase [Acidimicrobiales bacterium]|nr:phosphoribosylformylglycinamidine cyclo-ligase [Acidimicrobiales bacterium]
MPGEGAAGGRLPEVLPEAPLTYAAAGVDIDAGERAVDLMGSLVASTARPEVMGGLGAFGGLFSMPAGFRSPVLVASTDGVGTKLAVAVEAGRLGTIGVDLVAMCVDDVVCQGAEPLFFLDYQLWGYLDPEAVAEIMRGIAEGCRQAGCAILGGELAEHPGQLRPGEMDLAGFAVGVVERDRILGPGGPNPPREGDALVGLYSGGLRSNGYSLVRAALLERAGRRLHDEAWPGAGHSLADELLRPSLVYTPAVLALLPQFEVRAAAHITGGGLPGNVPRALAPGLDAVLHPASWPVPPVFAEVQKAAAVDDAEMYRTFNMGLGMVLTLPPGQAAAAVAKLDGLGFRAGVVGEVVAGDGRCLLE